MGDHLIPLMIPKAELIDGTIYEGLCRNATEARWHVATGKFIYMRHKFGQTFEEDICHPDDDQVYDVFVPIKIKE